MSNLYIDTKLSSRIVLHPSQMKKEVEKPIINTEPIVPYNYKPYSYNAL